MLKFFWVDAQLWSAQEELYEKDRGLESEKKAIKKGVGGVE